MGIVLCQNTVMETHVPKQTAVAEAYAFLYKRQNLIALFLHVEDRHFCGNVITVV